MLKQSKSNSKIIDKFEKVIKPLSRLGAQKHLMALRDGFVLTLPFTIAGAMAILFITVVFGGWGAQKTSLIGLIAHASGSTKINYVNLFNGENTWVLTGGFKEIALWGQSIFKWINAATLGFISIYAAFGIGYSMSAIRRAKSNFIGAGISVAIFLVLVGGDKNFFGATGMLPAIIAGLAGTEIYLLLMNNEKIKIKLPSSVPPAVGRAFSALFPGFLTLSIFGLLNIIASSVFIGIEGKSLSDGAKLLSVASIINTVILQPFIIFSKSGGDIALLYVYVFFVGLLWFFGLHGSNTIDGAFAPIGIILWIDNMNGGHNVAMGQVWNGFGFFGGAGGTISLVVLTVIFMKKSSTQKEVAKFALPAGIFNINEPVIFGFPIILNMIYFIPFIFAVPVSLVWPIIAIKYSLMNAPTLIAPWTTPPILYGLLVTQFDWRSIIVSILVLATQILIWTPFVLTQRNIEAKSMKEKDMEQKVVKNE